MEKEVTEHIFSWRKSETLYEMMEKRIAEPETRLESDISSEP